MSVARCIILGMSEFKSYWYVCQSCDASIEIVSRGIHFQDPSCNCSDPAVVWCQTSVLQSDTQPNERNKMLDNLESSMGNLPLSDAERYNPNVLVTYKKIPGTYAAPESVEYVTDKVTSIEWDLHNGRQYHKTAESLKNKIDAVKDIILEAYEDSEDKDTLRAIAEALDIELVKEVQFTASIEVSGTYTYDIMSDYSEYDLDTVVTDSLFADSNDGNIQIDDTEVCNVREA